MRTRVTTAPEGRRRGRRLARDGESSSRPEIEHWPAAPIAIARPARNGGTMQQSRWERLAPLTGVVAVAIVIAVFAIGGSTPDEHDSATKVWAYYSRHHDKQITLAFILAIALPFLVFFASTLRPELRR